MSLWFQPPSATADPADSRQTGFGQTRALGPSFTLGGPEENSPMSSAAGGVTLNYGSRASISSNIDNSFNFDGPHFYNNSLTYDNTVNNNILQNFTINNLMQFVRNIVATEGGGGGGGCSSFLDVVTDVSLSGSGLVFTRRNIGICGDTSATSVTINTNTCT